MDNKIRMIKHMRIEKYLKEASKKEGKQKTFVHYSKCQKYTTNSDNEEILQEKDVYACFYYQMRHLKRKTAF